MGVCSSKATSDSVIRSISVRKQSNSSEEFSMVVNSKRTAVPRLQPLHSNPLHARRKAKFQSSGNPLRGSSAMETYCASGQLDYQGDAEAQVEV
jgi:hypothetical protein